MRSRYQDTKCHIPHVERIGIGDFLLIAERITGIDAHLLARNPHLMSQAAASLLAPFSGFGDVEVFPGFHAKAAIYCSRIVRYHPLADGNKRAGYAVMREFIARNGYEWTQPHGGEDEIASVIEVLTAGMLAEDEFIAWVAERLG
jgi:death-on-curing protein